MLFAINTSLSLPYLTMPQSLAARKRVSPALLVAAAPASALHLLFSLQMCACGGAAPGETGGGRVRPAHRMRKKTKSKPHVPLHPCSGGASAASLAWR